jgi:hypothetical protein
VLYAVGALIVALGIVVAIGTILSALSSYRLPSIPAVPITSEAARGIAGLALLCVALILLFAFALYAGFKGRSVVSRVDLTGWDSLVRTLGILYFAATLFLAIAIFVIPGISAFMGGMAIMLLISSALIMVCALLAHLPRQSITAGILLIIAGVLFMLAGRISIPSLGMQLFGISELTSMLFAVGTLAGVAYIIVGVALILRQVILRWPISHIIASVGGVIYAANVAYSAFSAVYYCLSYPLPSGTILGPLETAFGILYSASVMGCSLSGIAGILGIISLIFAIVFVAKAGFPALARVEAPPPAGMPAKELRYCPGCGSPVDPEDVYCGKCGKKLR